MGVRRAQPSLNARPPTTPPGSNRSTFILTAPSLETWSMSGPLTRKAAERLPTNTRTWSGSVGSYWSFTSVLTASPLGLPMGPCGGEGQTTDDVYRVLPSGHDSSQG